MSVPLQDRPTEELRTEIRDSLQEIVTDLLAATQAAHGASVRVEDMNLKWVAGIGQEFDTMGDRLRSVHDAFRKANAMVEALAQRAKAGKL